MILPSLGDRALMSARGSVCLGRKEKLEYASIPSYLKHGELKKTSLLSLSLREFFHVRPTLAAEDPNPITEQVYAHNFQGLHHTL